MKKTKKEMSVKDYANLAGISITVVRKRIWSGQLKAKYYDGFYVIEKGENIEGARLPGRKYLIKNN